jgi:uncharacterized protein HemX
MRLTIVTTLLALLLALGGYLYHDHRLDMEQEAARQAQKAAADMEANRDKWKAAAERYQRDIQTLEDQRHDDQQAVRQLRADLAEQDHKYKALLARIRDSPDTDDGPVAPVLKQTLEAL